MNKEKLISHIEKEIETELKQLEFIANHIKNLNHLKENYDELVDHDRFELDYSFRMKLKRLTNEDICFNIIVKRPSKVNVKLLSIVSIINKEKVFKASGIMDKVIFPDLSDDLNKTNLYFEKFYKLKNIKIVIEDLVKKYDIKPNNDSQAKFIEMYYRCMNYNFDKILNYILSNNLPMPFSEKCNFFDYQEIAESYFKSLIL